MGFSKRQPKNDKSMEPLSQETIDLINKLRHPQPQRARIHNPTPHHDTMPDRDGKVTTRSPMIDRED